MLKILFPYWSRHPAQGVISAAVIIAVAGFFSRLLGVFRDRILAGQFGAGDELDIYYAAFRIPDLIYNLLIVGALSAGFIPVFVAARRRFTSRGSEEWYLANAFLTVVVVALVIVSGFGALFVYYLTPLIAPGFSADKIAEVARLSRIMFLSPLLLGISAVVGGVLQSYRNFFVFSLAPIFYNIGIIIGALGLVPFLGLSGLAWGVVIGAGLHLGIQLPAAARLGWSMSWVWDLKHQGLRTIGRLMVPRTLALSISQLNILFLTIMASYLASGSVTVFNLATNLFMLPVGTIGISYALAVFPTLAERAASGDQDGFRSALRQSVQQILFFIVPATILILLLRAQIVRSVLGSGAFDWDDTVMTFETLRYLSYGLFAQSLSPLLARAFYAGHNTTRPLMAGVIGDIITIGGGFLLMGIYGVVGLAIGFSAGAIAQFVVLWSALRWRWGDLGEDRILAALKLLILAGLAMAFVTQGVKTGIGQLLGTETFVDIFLQGGIAAFAGLVTYFVVLAMVGSEELETFVSAWRGRAAAIELSQEGLDEGEGI